MSTRRFRPMTASDLTLLPDPCSSCAFWESSSSGIAAPADQSNRRAVKNEWAEAVTRRWGYCGVVAHIDDQLVGFLTMAPPSYVPRLSAFASAQVSADTVVIMSVVLTEEFRGHGIGRQLVQSAAGLMVRRDIRALEAVGTHHDGPSCMLPVGWLEKVGFHIVRPHPISPRLRMDLQTSVRWKPQLSAAWNRLTGLVAQPATPEPATYAPREAVPRTR